MKLFFIISLFFCSLSYSQEVIDARVTTLDGYTNPWRIQVPQWIMGDQSKMIEAREWIAGEFEREFGRSPEEITNMDELLKVVKGIHRYSDWFSRMFVFGASRGLMGGAAGWYATLLAGATHEEALTVGSLYCFLSIALGFFNQEVQDYLTGGHFYRFIQRKFKLKASSLWMRGLRRFEEIARSFILEKAIVWSQASILVYATSQPNKGSETLIALAAALGQTLFEIANANIRKRKIAAGASPRTTQLISNGWVSLVAMLTVAAQFGALKGVEFAQWGLVGVMAMGITAYAKELWMEHVRKKKVTALRRRETLMAIRAGVGGRCAVFAF